MSDEIIQRPDPGEGEDKPEEPSGQASLTELFASWVSRSPSPEMGVASKMTPEHLTQSLGMVDAQNQRVLDDRNDQRKTTRYYITVGAVTALGITAIAGLLRQRVDHGELLGVGVVVGCWSLRWFWMGERKKVSASPFNALSALPS